MRKVLTTAIVAATMALAFPVFADPPPWAGGGKGHGDKGKGKGKGQEARGAHHFRDEHRVVVQDYYVAEFRRGHCPPGLAKKNNGCMPPGQAKKWRVGQALPGDVVYYTVPPTLVVKLGEPPPGHRYVRVAADILLITIGAAIVIDAIQG